jgi:hypothetical protein
MATRAHMKMPSRTCQSFTNTTVEDGLMAYLDLRVMPGIVRTEIPFNDRGILEVYHLGRQATETEPG